MSKNLLKSTVIFSSLTFVSRILGLLREMIFAHFFGATAGMDAFLVAFKIPNFLRRLFAEGAFSQAFVPVLSEARAKGTETELKELIRRVMGTLAGWLFVIGVLGSLLSSVWVAIFAPGFLDDPAKFDLAKNLLHITFPYIFFISLTALSGGILNTFSKFAVPAFTPVLLNICLILSVIFLRHYFAHPVTAAAWGVLIAGIVQFCFQLPFLHKMGFLVWPKWGWKHPGVKKLLKLMVPGFSVKF
jgi:putative peptidoglycan lipid II flippase